MASRHPQKFTQTQPRTYSVNLKAVLSLPFRLCNPPPAVGKVRSCGVTPLLKVRLEDVLDRQHLPPLGLKDFEEWLLFVEMSPENLYFILWLREYKQRFNQWKAQSAFQSRNAPPDFPHDWSAQYSSHLAMFYARAKQTFFTPGSEYELNLSSSLLAPFHKPNMPPHPHPELFREVEVETYRTLEASLRRFVHAQLNNVGTSRVLCGMIAGVLFCLLGAVPPLVLNFVRGDPRWTRLAALPGLWLGLTVLCASLNGICLGVYIFGDLRQLRKFELSRPPISKPQPLPAYYRRRSLGGAGGHAHAAPRPASANNSILPIQQPRHYYAGGMQYPLTRVSSISSAETRLSVASTSSTTSTDDNIHISPAYYDADDIEGLAAMTLYRPDPDFGFPEKRQRDQHEEAAGVGHQKQDPTTTTTTTTTTAASPAPSSFTATATFIHPFEDDDDDELERSLHLPARHQPLTPFDFDSLPVHPNARARANVSRSAAAMPSSMLVPVPLPAARGGVPPPLQALPPMHHFKRAAHNLPALHIPRPPEPAAPAPSAASLLGRMQERCNIARWRLQTGYLERDGDGGRDGRHSSPKPHPSSPYWAEYPYPHPQRSFTASARSTPTPTPLGGGGKRPSSLDSEKTHTHMVGDNVNSNSKVNNEKGLKADEDDVDVDVEDRVWRRFRMVRAVPAFAVPLTRVLSPVVVRGQWEIVVRSAVVAFGVAWVLVGALLAVPVVVVARG
ncbi:hypothetical protein BDZ97DRAFT_2058661 [Flammula alnicola]|nr:hypothetical protein BDZ97DRAFT_2058661 [Flammula alnicola]